MTIMEFCAKHGLKFYSVSYAIRTGKLAEGVEKKFIGKKWVYFLNEKAQAAMLELKNKKSKKNDNPENAPV